MGWSGTCAGIDREEATYSGTIRRSGKLVVEPKIVIDALIDTLEFEIPSFEIDLALGSTDVSARAEVTEVGATPDGGETVDESCERGGEGAAEGSVGPGGTTSTSSSACSSAAASDRSLASSRSSTACDTRVPVRGVRSRMHGRVNIASAARSIVVLHRAREPCLLRDAPTARHLLGADAEVATLETVAGPRICALVEAAVARGAPGGALLERLHLRAEDLAAPDLRIPVERFHEGWEHALRSTGEEALPVEAGRLATVPKYGMLGFQLYTSPSLCAAIEALVRYHVIVHELPTWAFEDSGMGGVVTWLDGGGQALGRVLAAEQALASLVQIGREILGGPVEIVETWLERSAPCADVAQREHFGGVVHWGASKSGVHLTRAALDAAPLGSDPLLGGFFAERAAASAHTARDSCVSRAARAIHARLAEGIPTITEIARELQLSERTLRRRLTEERSSFADLVAEAQLARAKEMLSRGASVHDVALATGFADPTTFSRAYRRWTGTAPSSSKKPR
jgi:AraC-like DNA-binding protein